MPADSAGEDYDDPLGLAALRSRGAEQSGAPQGARTAPPLLGQGHQDWLLENGPHLGARGAAGGGDAAGSTGDGNTPCTCPAPASAGGYRWHRLTCPVARATRAA